MINASALVGNCNILFITLDTLRYDVACSAMELGATPFLAGLLPNRRWDERHSPGSYTYASHHSFFAGFLPTPVNPGVHQRLFAAEFTGSETTGPQTYVFNAPDIVTGLRNIHYRTICIGGVGFFNKQTALGTVLPSLFEESYWSPQLGVTDPKSTENQVALALSLIEKPQDRKLFMFINVSAMHQPNYFYVPGAMRDTVQTQASALSYVDKSLPALFEGIRRLGPSIVIICSDHGTAYGEDGYYGHRIAHPVVWTVPYADFLLE